MQPAAATEIKIDKGIPIPTARDCAVAHGCHPRPKWTELLRKMVKGDSFVTERTSGPAVLSSGHRLGVKLIRRLGPDDELQIPAGKVRIWRTN